MCLRTVYTLRILRRTSMGTNGNDDVGTPANRWVSVFIAYSFDLNANIIMRTHNAYARRIY